MERSFRFDWLRSSDWRPTEASTRKAGMTRLEDSQLEKQAYIDDMVRRRGYALDYHKVMVSQDLPVLKAADALISAAYLAPRLLDRKTKELIFIVSLTV